MAIKVPSAADAAKKWGEVTPGRQGYYEAGAKAAGADWEKNTVDASKAFKAAISAGNIEQMFAGGVKKAGAAKFVRKVTDVGAARFSQGVTAAVGDMQTGIEPMLATIAGVTLPARQPRGSAGNLQRVSVIADALNKKRLALRAAGA
jgi:hypothetical protein